MMQGKFFILRIFDKSVICLYISMTWCAPEKITFYAFKGDVYCLILHLFYDYRIFFLRGLK